MFSEMKDAFDLFDKNGDQKISVSELGMVLRSLGQNPTDKEVEEIMKKADKDGMYGNFPHNCLGWGGEGVILRNENSKLGFIESFRVQYITAHEKTQ